MSVGSIMHDLNFSGFRAICWSLESRP